MSSPTADFDLWCCSGGATGVGVGAVNRVIVRSSRKGFSTARVFSKPWSVTRAPMMMNSSFTMKGESFCLKVFAFMLNLLNKFFAKVVNDSCWKVFRVMYSLVDANFENLSLKFFSTEKDTDDFSTISPRISMLAKTANMVEPSGPELPELPELPVLAWESCLLIIVLQVCDSLTRSTNSLLLMTGSTIRSDMMDLATSSSVSVFCVS